MTVSGAVTGNSGNGINTVTGSTGTSVVMLNSGASVTGAIRLGSGDDDLTFSNVTGTVVGGAILGMENVTANAGASMAFTGAIALDGHNNNVTFDNGIFSGVTSFNGGAGTDSLTFRNLTGALAGGTVSGTLDVNTVTVENGCILGGTGTINANVGVTTGTLSAGNSPGPRPPPWSSLRA